MSEEVPEGVGDQGSKPSLWGRLRRRRSGRRDLTIRLDNQRSRLDNQKKRLDDHGRRLDRQRGDVLRLGRSSDKHMDALRGHAAAIEELRGLVRDMRERARVSERAARVRELEHGRMEDQLAAIEERLGRIDTALADGLLVDDGGSDEGRTVLEEIRREHQQIRVRMQFIGAYEERLRRVEATALALYDGDHRHQV